MDGEFGRQLRAARQRAGISQRALAELAGVHQPTIAAVETGRRGASDRTREQLLAAVRVRPSVALRQNVGEVRTVIARHRGTDPMVFGSVARGEDTTGSDLDLIVTFPDGTDLFDVMDLTDELEALVGVRVDIASGRSTGSVMERARREAVAL